MIELDEACDAPPAHPHGARDDIPPDDAWDPIQEARALVRDRGLWRWPPHANMLYPFHEPAEFDLAAPILSHALASVRPFEVELREFDIFEHSSRSATLWVRPDPSREGALQELHSALESALPHCNHQTADHGGAGGGVRVLEGCSARSMAPHAPCGGRPSPPARRQLICRKRDWVHLRFEAQAHRRAAN